MPILQHRKTRKDAIWVDTSRHSDDAIKINEPDDLSPAIAAFRQVNIDPWFIEQGLRALDIFLKAFFDNKPKVYYVWIFKSAFTDDDGGKDAPEGA